MRPAYRPEVKEHCLAVLNLRIEHFNRLARSYVCWRGNANVGRKGRFAVSGSFMRVGCPFALQGGTTSFCLIFSM
jgi:hypothetical protein